MKKHEQLFWGIFSFVCVMAIWQITVTLMPGTRFPSFTEVIKAFFVSFVKPIGRYTLLTHMGWSLSRVFVGYVIAAISGIILGLIMGLSDYARAFFKPIFDLLRPIPPIAWIPLAILWFGIEEQPKYFLIWLAGFTAFTLNSYLGFSQVDRQLIGAARMLGADEKQVFYRVILPATVPQLFSGAQVALSNSMMAVVGAEMVKSSEGLGWIIIMGNENGDFCQMIVGMIAIGLIGLFLATTMRFIERRLIVWNVQGK